MGKGFLKKCPYCQKNFYGRRNKTYHRECKIRVNNEHNAKRNNETIEEKEESDAKSSKETKKTTPKGTNLTPLFLLLSIVAIVIIAYVAYKQYKRYLEKKDLKKYGNSFFF